MEGDPKKPEVEYVHVSVWDDEKKKQKNEKKNHDSENNPRFVLCLFVYYFFYFFYFTGSGIRHGPAAHGRARPSVGGRP